MNNSEKAQSSTEVFHLLIESGWAYHGSYYAATCRWCHRIIHGHEVLLSPRGTVYHENCAVQRYLKSITRRNSEKAQSLVEFAILFPIILVILLLLVEVGFLIWDVMELQQTTREIARYAAKGVDYYNDTTTVGDSSVFGVARDLGVSEATHALRITYVELADVDGVATVVETQMSYFGMSTAMRDVNLGNEYQAFIDFSKRESKYPKLDDATWVVVDLVYFRELRTGFFGKGMMRLPARAVFQVSYQRRK